MNNADLTVSLLTLGDPNRLTGGYLYHVRMAERAPAHCARVDFLSFPDRPFPLPTLASRRLLGAAAARGADVLLLDSIAAAYLGPWVTVRPLPAPLVGIVHQPPGGIDHGRWRTRLQAALDRLTYLRAQRLMVASETLAAGLVGMGVPAHRVQVVPPGRDVAATADGTLPDLREGRQAALLCVGSWVPRKGILDAVDAVSRMPPDAATLHLVGDDRADPRYRASISARLSEPGLADRVRVHGPLPPDQTAAFYSGADVFVLPSIREPYGTVYGEAMAAGLPVAGWDAGNLPHLATDGREGVILPIGDVGGLAAALTRLAEDGDERRRMGAAAKRRAAELPTWDDSAAVLFASLREVAS